MNSPYVRKACVTLALLGSATLLCAQRAPQKSPPPWFWGCWVVKKDIASRISGLSQKQVDAVIGTHVFFSPACARSGGQSIKSPVYSVSAVSEDDFFRLGYHVNLAEIGVRGRSVTRVEVRLPDNLSDMDFPAADVYLREGDIVIEVEGVYLVAERAKPGDARCACEAPSPR